MYILTIYQKEDHATIMHQAVFNTLRYLSPVSETNH